jgi:hypothetical protein
MKFSRVSVALAVSLLVQGVSATPQIVGGISIEYPGSFMPGNVLAQSVMGQQAPDAKGQIRSVEAFVAPANGDTTEVSIVKTVYRQAASIDLDGAAIGAVNRMRGFDGVSHFRHEVRSYGVSGLDARRVSVTAVSRVGPFAIEALLFAEKNTGRLYVIMCAVGRRQTLDLELARRAASSTLATVRLLP